MKVLVMYYSKTGNTEKLAKEVAEGVKNVEDVECVVKQAVNVTKDDLLSSNGVIVGSPCYFGTMAAEVKEVLDKFVIIRKQMENKVGAAFATSGGPSGGKETTLISILQALLIYGMIVVGDPMDATGHYGTASAGMPDEKDAENARKLGQRVSNVVKKLGD
ncbi:MAG: NAD(P)H-dependent oxidoreductase [Candidatus Thermoplasmatota archaeon]